MKRIAATMCIAGLAVAGSLTAGCGHSASSPTRRTLEQKLGDQGDWTFGGTTVVCKERRGDIDGQPYNRVCMRDIQQPLCSPGTGVTHTRLFVMVRPDGYRVVARRAIGIADYEPCASVA